ncbi:acetoacetyl-coenzyme A synthetase [Microdochium trichocladiopsis]|uniref:Acetoacetyl-coenzyme A synthetase n=1 Tax=Microdochium trichocladiopsis TaxID=1682393 RepID=A0A9P9BPD1_9PEZI|nr:acetoacetyl-coenzyme A synthetase [Microdochium trichocladiopsis]KAH7033009.1 acetoacetyl-coenzyme A synthetase [Microdochium trichocladiopsis]
MSSEPLPRELWSHPDPESTQMYKFMQLVNRDHHLKLSTFQDLYQWSIDHRSKFYAQLFDYLHIIHEGSYTRVVDESAPINDLPHWFEGVRLNFAENVLWSRSSAADPEDYHGTTGKEDSKIALTAVREGCTELKEVSWGELRARSAHYAAALKALGVGRGDRIVVVGSNSVETQLILIATTWVGGIFSSSSSDMGAQGVLQRTVQIDPKFIFMDDAAVYNGKTLDLRDKMSEILKGMEPCANFQGLISIPRFEQKPLDISKIPRTQTLDNFLSSTSAAAAPPPIERLAFHDPFLICYSSGTTGIPKAIVHSVGGVLVSLFKEGRLHSDATPSDVALQYTTVGWIMLLQIPAQLCVGARVILYDGSPFIPDAKAFVRLIGEQKVTKLGISPRWMAELVKAGISPRELTNLSNLKLVTSTGMVLSNELFEWFYEKGFPAQVHLSNISGGTDIAGCFAAGNPLTPVRVGGIQGPSLGVPIAVYDSLVEAGGPGSAVPDGTPGELVATASFPNVPVFLWGDGAAPNDPDLAARADKSKYHGAYFARYGNNVWAHGDHVVVHPVTKQITFLGRADGVLNPSGVRFGSAEIYSVLEQGALAEEIADSVVVGQRRPGVDSDESVMLFLMMRPGKKFGEDLVRRVREAIARERSKRHVPKYIFETPEIPVSKLLGPSAFLLLLPNSTWTTINGKKIEIAVKKIVCGETVKPSGTVSNPDSLKYYYQFARVEELVPPRAKL